MKHETPPCNALVVAESHFGNTVALADAVAASLRSCGVLTTFWMAHEAENQIVVGTSLIILAAPTHEGSLSTPTTRKRAAGLGAKDSTDGFGVREWVTTSVGARSARVITTGTADHASLSAGRTAAAAAAALASLHGFGRVEEGPTFAVSGVAGPLEPGALPRAREWARSIATHEGAEYGSG